MAASTSAVSCTEDMPAEAKEVSSSASTSVSCPDEVAVKVKKEFFSNRILLTILFLSLKIS